MKNLTKLFIVAFAFVSIISCNNSATDECCDKEKQETTASVETSDYLINATLWVQQSAEYQACCYQAFNHAKLALDVRMNLAPKDKPLAVVFDLDETLLDNSYFEANLIETNTSYTKENWKEWSDMECATATPGAIDFLNYVISKDIEIVYISNRREDELDATIANMEKIGFPTVEKENFFFRTDESSKINRRALAAENYNLILFVGDNLSDFDGMFDDRSQNFGKDVVEQNKDRFGSDFIILPNPMYGKWEQVLPADETKTATENRINNVIGYDENCK